MCFGRGTLLFLLFGIAADVVEIVKGGVFLFCFFRQVFIKRVGNQGIFMDSLFHGVADTGGSFFMDSCPGNGVRKRAGSRNDEFFRSSRISSDRKVKRKIPVCLPAYFIA